LETLNKEGIREALISFYEKYYSAKLMKLVVMSPDPLDVLQKSVVEKFSAIPKKDISRPKFDGSPWDLSKHANQLIKMRTLKNVLELEISWFIACPVDENNTKPIHYLEHILSHQCEGSLFQALRRRGWITFLDHDLLNVGANLQQFSFIVTLTQLGFDEYKQVVKMVFRYIGLLLEWGPKSHIWYDIRQMDAINFRFHEITNFCGHVSDISQRLHSFENKPHCLFSEPAVPDVYDEPVIELITRELRLDNFQLTLYAQHPFTALDSIKVEPWYEIHHSVNPISPQDMSEYRNAFELNDLTTEREELFLPGPNPYIPCRFDTNPISEQPNNTPKKLVSLPNFDVWYKADDTFQQPKSKVIIFFRADKLRTSAFESARMGYFKKLMDHCLSVHEAVLAGLQYDFNFAHFGLKLCVFGYSDKLPLLVQCILEYASNLEFSETDFKAMRNGICFPQILPLGNLSSHLLSGIEAILNCDHFHLSDVIDAWERVNRANITGFWRELLDSCTIQVLIHGSLSEDEALLLSDSIRTLTSKSNDSNSHQCILKPYPRAYNYIPHEGSHIVLVPESVDHQDNIIAIMFPIALKNSSQHMLLFLLQHILNECFFDVIRTKEQLGYCVSLELRSIGNMLALSFIVQSKSDPIFLDGRIESFIRDFVPNHLKALSIEQFNHHRSASVRSLTMKRANLESECDGIWWYIFSGFLDFESASTDAALLGETGKDALINFFEAHIHPDGKKRIKLGIHVWAKQDSENPINKRRRLYIHSRAKHNNPIVNYSEFNGRVFADRRFLVDDLNLQPHPL